MHVFSLLFVVGFFFGGGGYHIRRVAEEVQCTMCAEYIQGRLRISGGTLPVGLETRPFLSAS